jgi:hypothetical protein
MPCSHPTEPATLAAPAVALSREQLLTDGASQVAPDQPDVELGRNDERPDRGDAAGALAWLGVRPGSR